MRGGLRRRLADKQIGKGLILVQAADGLRQKGGTGKNLHLIPHRARASRGKAARYPW